MLTGLAPSEHGIVGNGWYFRDLGEVHLWRQHNALVQGEKVWETARKAKPGFTAANVGWWYAMGASTDITVTPRPIYHADGRKSPDAYVRPPGLHDELTGALGEFPLFQYWGPTASITSKRSKPTQPMPGHCAGIQTHPTSLLCPLGGAPRISVRRLSSRRRRWSWYDRRHACRRGVW